MIRALLMREVITRFGRHNVGVLWLVGEPMIFTLGVAALWSAAGMSHGSGLPIIAFAITGYSSVLMWRNSVSRCNSAIQQNFGLLYHRNVQVIDVFVTRIMLEIAGATGSFMVLALFFTIGGWIQPPEDLLKVVCGWLMLAWFGTALALAVGAATAYSRAHRTALASDGVPAVPAVRRRLHGRLAAAGGAGGRAAAADGAWRRTACVRATSATPCGPTTTSATWRRAAWC